MMKRTNESGRSMVEMLGVLAIIGVLSVGGIAGYTMAMNRYRANEVIDMANKYAVVAFAARETHRTMNNGTVDTQVFKAPTFCDTGLVKTETTTTGSGESATTTTTCTVNNTTIGTAAYYDNVNCTGTAISTGTASALGVKIELDFGDAGVCNAAATTLGTTCNSSKVTYCARNS